MGINLSNFFTSKTKNKKMNEFQDLDHIDGVSISTVSANLYNNNRDDLVMFYFRDGANYASVYTQSKIISENIRWNLKQKAKKIFSLVVNTRNANCFTGKQGYKSLEKIAELITEQLSEKQKKDEDYPKKIKLKDIIFGCTGTIGEVFPDEKIKNKIPDLVGRIKYTQNKYIWMKAALGIMTTDTLPKMAMEECKIGNSKIKIFAVEPEDSAVISGGEPGTHMIQGIGAGFIPENLLINMVDEIISINNNTAFEYAKIMARVEGIPVGISSGAALAAAIEINEQPCMDEKNTVVIIPSFAERYLSTPLFSDL